MNRIKVAAWREGSKEASGVHGMGGLYDPCFEHDACGVGFVVRAGGQRDHGILIMALEAVRRLSHRGAVAADGVSGDGAGVLTQIPRRLLLREAARLGWALDEGVPFGLGMLFLPSAGGKAESVLEEALAVQGLTVVGWRTVPVEPEALGDSARATMPRIRQVVAVAAPEVDESVLERRLYLARKQFEREGLGGYVCSLSCRTVVYKALCAARQLPAFYGDLADPEYETAMALFHQRYSTNTMPSWPLAQPFRMAGHNGEINTLWGNRRWMRARSRDLPSELMPVLDPAGSDSASLDEALELLTRGGRGVAHALSMLMVPAWEEDEALAPELAAFYRYHASVMEPWDGPAALAFTDGTVVGAALDRNGLRPCRYKVTADGLVVAGSEVGLFDLDEDAVVEKGRLGPGQMLVVDLERGEVLRDTELKTRLASTAPFSQLLGARPLLVERGVRRGESGPDPALHQLFGIGAEDLRYVLGPMVEDGKAATWSMGDDTPVPPLARSPRSLYASLRQRFAQVTNPPIDPLRETSVMSLRTWLGPRPELLAQGPQGTVLEMASPVATADTMRELRRQGDLEAVDIETVLESPAEPLPRALDRLSGAADAAVEAGASLLILSDRSGTPATPPIPMALALGSVHHYLVTRGLRSRVGLVVEAGDCWDPHHLAVLVGYGAGAVCPWLALETARSLEPDQGEDRLVTALEGGLRKVMSKMGISTVASYRGAQLFEALGLAGGVVDRCFTGTPNRLGGVGWGELEDGLRRRAATSAGAEPGARLPDYGLVRFRRDAERHAWSPYAARALQRAVATGRYAEQDPDPEAWREFRSLAVDEVPSNLRDLLATTPAGPAVSLADVEPAESIARRFVTSAMSLGALSPEAHRTLTLAMNRLGARSNTGEGGEDPAWYRAGDGPRQDGKIKQVASGRFGVTAEYIARAEELEIKMAQGSKPGEGGQLPGHKVTELIARLRHAQPGISLISPPPHHDIYSIEDLAQLIYDLKRCNPTARVGVKLVAEAGVGTIAAGVAKAYADYVVISGHAGGTGASPLSSIKHAGSPWELGLAEAQQVLVRNGLRSRVRLRTDGGLMTGSDVLVAALLGAEEFGFGTGPLVAMGCDMARQCHLNTCPTGIATQKEELRTKFRGDPEHVMRYFLLIAEEVRTLLAGLGLSSLDEAVGRADLLRQTSHAGGLDMTPVLAVETGDALRCTSDRNDRPEKEPLDEGLAREARRAIRRATPFRATREIRNSDRSVGARLAGLVASEHGGAGLPMDTLVIDLSGAAGQSFGAFAPPGLTLRLTGEANDYVGKGLCGGELVLKPVGLAAKEPHQHVILGNVALYGATSGRLFAAGGAGERFAVRNSGATAVVEGVGDHGCEYMTGGLVLVLGPTGSNFGAGMTGGTAYLLDSDGAAAARVNDDFVVCRTPEPEELERIRFLLAEHVDLTGSAHGSGLLADWPTVAPAFRVVAPRQDDASAAALESGADDQRMEA